MDARRVLIILLTSWTLSASAPAADLLSAMMTRAVPPGSCTPTPTPVTSFAVSETAAFLFFSVANARPGDTFRTEWRDPGGRLLSPPFWPGGEKGPLETGGTLCFSERLDIANRPAADLPGSWRVDLYWNNIRLTTLNFVLVESIVTPGTAPPRITIHQTLAEACPRNGLVLSVLNQDGEPVRGLTAANFLLVESGQPRPSVVGVTGPAGGASPMAIALFVDTNAGLSEAALSEMKAALREFLNQLPAEERVALFSFGDMAVLRQDYTLDRLSLGAAVDRLAPGGARATYSAVESGARNLGTYAGRKAVVVITDGEATSPGASLEQAIAVARFSGTPVFTVGYGSANHTALERLAGETSGFHSRAASAADLRAVLRRLARLLAGQYEVSYTSSDPNLSHSVELTVLSDGHRVATQRRLERCVASRGLHLAISQVVMTSCPTNSLIVTLADGQGDPVGGLTALNFILREGGRERPVRVNVFGSTPASQAMSVAVLLDSGAAVPPQDEAAIKAAARTLVSSLPASAAIAVFSASGLALRQLDFSFDRVAINGAIDAIQRQGSPALYDSVAEAARSLSLRSGRKAIVLLALNRESGSRITLDAAISQALQASAPVFATNYGLADAVSLARLSTESGGLPRRLATAGDLNRTMRSLASVLNEQYEVIYTGATTEQQVELLARVGADSAMHSRRVERCLPPQGATLSIHNVTSGQGASVDVPVALTSAGGAPAAFQFDLTYDTTRLRYNSARAGPELLRAGKELTVQILGSGQLRIVGAALNPNPIADGVVALLNFTLLGGFTGGSTSLACSSPAATDPQGRPVQAACPSGSVAVLALTCGCDVNGDGRIDAADVQTIINQVLGIAPAVCDVDGNGMVDIGDVQKVVNAVLGFGCR